MKFNDKPLVNGLIGSEDKHKYQFLIFILEQSSISFDLTLKDEKGNSVLYEAIHNTKFYAQYIIQLIFIRGYKMNEIEESYLIDRYKDPTTRPEYYENILLALISFKLSTPKLILKSRNILRIIYTFLSFKTKKVVGFKLNHTALANNFLQHHQEFSTLFIRALKHYKYYETLKTKPSFVKKENTILENTPFQETEYDEVLRKMFPELYD